MILKMSSPSQSQACHNHQNYNFKVYLLRPKQFFLGKKKQCQQMLWKPRTNVSRYCVSTECCVGGQGNKAFHHLGDYVYLSSRLTTGNRADMSL